MDELLQRYLDGITALLSITAGELFALGLPARMEAARWLWGLGVGAIAWALVTAYQRGVVSDTSDPITSE